MYACKYISLNLIIRIPKIKASTTSQCGQSRLGEHFEGQLYIRSKWTTKYYSLRTNQDDVDGLAPGTMTRGPRPGLVPRGTRALGSSWPAFARACGRFGGLRGPESCRTFSGSNCMRRLLWALRD